MQSFKDLDVWRLGHAVVLRVYRLTKGFPEQERFGLTSQLRRAAVSVPTNIAEGSKRQSRRNYAHFLNLAEGSLAESQYLILLSSELEYVSREENESLQLEMARIARMLHALRIKVRRHGKDSV